MMRAVCLCLSLMTLLYLILNTGWPTGVELTSLNWPWAAPVFLVGVFQVYLCSCKWQRVASFLGLEGRQAEFFRCSVWANAVNLMLPSSLFGEVTRFSFFRKKFSKGTLIESQVWDRLTTHSVWILALCLIKPWLGVGLVALTLLVWGVKLMPKFQNLTGRLKLLWDLPVVVMSLAINGAVILMIGLLSELLNLNTQLEQLFWLSPYILAALAVPFFYSGWGAREAVLIYFATPLGLEASQALCLSVCVGLAQVLVAVALLALVAFRYELPLYRLTKKIGR